MHICRSGSKMELYQVINSLVDSLITLLWTCLDMTVTYTENVVANTQLNFVQELLNPKVACVFKHNRGTWWGSGCYWPKYIHSAHSSSNMSVTQFNTIIKNFFFSIDVVDSSTTISVTVETVGLAIQPSTHMASEFRSLYRCKKKVS